MSRAISNSVLALLAVICVGSSIQCANPEADCAELQQQVTELTQRLESLERQLAGRQAATPRPGKPAAKKPGEIDPIYGKIDLLLASNKIDEAQALYEARKATGEVSSTMNTLNREMAVVGQPVPQDWAIEKWFQGQSKVNLDDKGTKLLVFWEAWCPHCKNEMPRMQAIHDKLKSKGLQGIGVTRITKTATEDAVRGVVNEKGVDFAIAKESGALAQFFKVKGIPAAAVVRDGTIIWRGHPSRLTDNMLRSWL